MSRMKSYYQDWLDRCGYRLGYDMGNAPDISDIDWVTAHQIDAEDYHSCAGLAVNK